MGSDSTFDVVLRHWYVVLTIMVAAVVGAWLVARMLPTEYTASTTLRLHPIPVDGIEQPYRLDYADRVTNSLATIAESEWMSRQLAALVGTSIDTRVVTELPANTDVLRLRFTDPDPILAARAANEAGRILIELSVEGTAGAPPASSDTEPVGTLELRQFAEALPPQEPSNLALPIILALGALAGLVVGSALAALIGGGRRASAETHSLRGVASAEPRRW